MATSAVKILKGAALLSIGQVSGYGLSFARNLILARMLTKADFGLVAALSMTMSLLELVSRMAFGNQIVQARQGDDPLFQAVAHSAQMAVGVISGLLVIGASYPMARAFNVPDLTWVFMLLAVVPLARASMHLDLPRLQREFIFGPAVLSELLPQALATAAAWPLTAWLGDFRAVLWIILGREGLTVVMSHLLAKRPYRWAWQRSYVKQMLAFGWPLLFNGLVMFASQQGDQVLIGASFSLSDLGSYSITFTITSVPLFIFGQVGSSLMLPSMSRHQDNPVLLERQYCRCLELSVIAALIILGPLIVAGDPIVRILYGAKYSGVGKLMTVFGAIVALRFSRLAPTILTMSRADTVNQLICNIARSTSLPLALLVVALGTKNMAAVAACGLVGEMAAISVTILRIWRRHRVPLSVHIKPMLFLVSWITTGALIQNWLGEGRSLWMAGAGALALWGLGAIASFILFPTLLSLYRETVMDLRTRLIFGRR